MCCPVRSFAPPPCGHGSERGNQKLVGCGPTPWDRWPRADIDEKIVRQERWYGGPGVDRITTPHFPRAVRTGKGGQC
jgi:hypothetical protein